MRPNLFDPSQLPFASVRVPGSDAIHILREAGYAHDIIEDLLINQIAVLIGNTSGSVCRSTSNQVR